MAEKQMPSRFREEGVQIEFWGILEKDNPIIGKILERQERQKGDGDLFIIRLTEPCRGREADREVLCKPGDIVAVDVKHALEALNKHVGRDVEVYIRPIEQVPTKDGQRSYWKFQLGSVELGKK